MKRTIIAVAATAAALLGSIAAASPALADDRVCNGKIGKVTIDDNIVVPSGATCTLKGTTVKANVLVEDDGSLVTVKAKIEGNIQSEGFTSVVVKKKTVVDGDIQLEDGDAFSVTKARVDGNIQVEDNDGPHSITKNTVNGDIQANDNDGGISITSNVVDGNLQCEGNDPAPTGGNNRVEGDKEGQCSGL